MLAILYLAGDAAGLQYDRQAIAGGEVWRCLTSHLVHWSFDHFLWCSLTFAVLGAVCERLSARGYLATLAAAGCTIPLAAWFFQPDMMHYRGLSGLASAVFIFTAAMLAQDARRRGERLVLALAVLAGAAFSGKILFEYATGSALFADSRGLFTPVPLVHLAGGLTGLAGAWVFRAGNNLSCRLSRIPANT